MRLLVRVLEGRNLRATDSNGFSDSYVKLQLGKQKFKTKVVKKSLNPHWGEEFNFRVEDLKEELIISVLDEDKYFNDDFVGQIKVPVSRVFDANDKCLDTDWHSLQPKSKKSKNKDCGEILLSICFLQCTSFGDMNSNVDLPQLRKSTVVRMESPSRSDVSEDIYEQPSMVNFEDSMKVMEAKDGGKDIPTTLPGGILIDQEYAITPQALNSLLFSPDSSFPKQFADIQGTTDQQFEHWKFESDSETMRRVITYVKAATKLMKAIKAIEEQTYLKADGKVFALLASVSTPDVMYGSTFKVELLYCIMPGSELPSGDQTSHFTLSWRLNFVQSTIMKGMIENGARQGLKESFEQFSSLLSEHVKPVDLKGTGSCKDQVLASLQPEPQSDWKLAVRYFANLTIISTILIIGYVVIHMWIATPSMIQGLEFVGLDLPDSIGEVIVSAIIVLQCRRVLDLASRFMQARAQKGSDHGVKAQGNGWLLTVALIEGSSLATVDSSGFCDPYVVFTCNGKTRTSSVKFQKSNPLWNEIFEFDAMNEPPSMLGVEVYDFDGPFDEPMCLGHTEVNFLKSNISDLADIWVPLQGKLAQACQSKLHLRIFLDNTRGSNVVTEYLSKMEKEVGKKINVRSPQTNSAFQKLFSLPPEEFLINDFTCHLKRKMPLQGRLFLSARIIGFYSNLFGRKTKFFILWEDIEVIKTSSPTLSSMGSPIIIVTLRSGRGLDARHGAKAQDEHGRLKFHFQSFVSFGVALRTIMALWKARSLSLEQKSQIFEEESETKTVLSEDSGETKIAESKSLETKTPQCESVETKMMQDEDCGENKITQTEDNGSVLDFEDVTLSDIYQSSLSIPVNLALELFNGTDLERRIMEKAGCLHYSYTPWESEKSDVYERQIYYKFDKYVTRYRAEATSIQQKYSLPEQRGWVIEEVMTLHGIPLGDYFNLHLKYQLEDAHPRPKVCCSVHVFGGFAWLKSIKNKKRITKNIISNIQDRLKMIFSGIEKELING